MTASFLIERLASRGSLEIPPEESLVHAQSTDTALGNAVTLPLGRVRGDHDMTRGGRPRSDIPLTSAGVLVPIVLHETGPTIILTQRTGHLTDHAGQISFPGGRLEEGDEDIVACALRESWEEIGLPATHVRVIGRLDTYVTGSRYRITPIVGLVQTPYPMTRDPFEVEEVFEVPLSFIVDPANHERRSATFQDIAREFYVLPYQNRYIWGATAGMLVNLSEVLAPQ